MSVSLSAHVCVCVYVYRIMCRLLFVCTDLCACGKMCVCVFVVVVVVMCFFSVCVIGNANEFAVLYGYIRFRKTRKIRIKR